MYGRGGWATVHGVAKSQTWLSNFTFTFKDFSSLFQKCLRSHSLNIGVKFKGFNVDRMTPLFASKEAANLGKVSFRLALSTSAFCECTVTQWCPTLWDPMDCSLPGSSVHETSPSKNTGVGCAFLLQENLSDPETEPASLALASILFNTAPPGKPHQHVLVDLGETVELPGSPRLPGEISISSDMQKTPPLWQKAKRN